MSTKENIIAARACLAILIKRESALNTPKARQARLEMQLHLALLHRQARCNQK